MGFVWVNACSFFHCVASPFHSFVTTLGNAIAMVLAASAMIASAEAPTSVSLELQRGIEAPSGGISASVAAVF